MYPSVRPSVLTEPAPAPASERDGRRPWVSANVVYIGLTSLFTDVSSEMVTAILPLYLVFQLRLTPLQFGVFNGVYLAVAGLMSIAGAVIADRRRRYKEIAGAGYGISAACKVGLLAARERAVARIHCAVRDRVGKGVRTSPRDALISLSSEPDRLGRSFGVHRVFDTIGAVAGPIVAFLVLRAAPDAYDAVFVISFLFALLGLGMLVLFVENRRDELGEHRSATWRGALRLLTEPRLSEPRRRRLDVRRVHDCRRVHLSHVPESVDIRDRVLSPALRRHRDQLLAACGARRQFG